MTAVEWLEKELKDRYPLMNSEPFFEQAKQMEKEQSIAELRHKDGTPMRKYNSPKLQEIEMENKQTAVEWFAQQLLSYKNPTNINGTDYISIPINKVEFLETKAKQMEKEQTEISDDEIEKSNPFRIDGGAYNSSAAYQWLKGAIWYREQLNNKNE